MKRQREGGKRGHKHVLSKPSANGGARSPTLKGTGININCWAAHTHMQTMPVFFFFFFFFFGTVHRSSQELTSTISLTSNSPVYSGYSCYTHLIIVLDLVPLVLLPFESASFTHTRSSQDGIQSNINPAAGHETPEVSACYSGNMRFGTS